MRLKIYLRLFWKYKDDCGRNLNELKAPYGKEENENYFDMIFNRIGW